MNAVREAVAAAWGSGPLFVGYSGGLDSTVLLHAARRECRGRPLTAVHVDHALHPESARWHRHCEAVCADLGVALVARRVRVPSRGNVEAQARAARYAVFAELLARGGLLFLAHHRDDQAETVLLRLLQGRGLYGMPRARPFGAGTLVRPLLDLPRARLAEYAARHGLAWVDDPANADQALDRNFLRHALLPDIRRRWPNVDEALIGAMERHRLADRLLAQSAVLGRDWLPVADLAAVPSRQRPELLRVWLAGRGIAAPPRTALAEFDRQLHVAVDRNPELEVKGAVLRRYRGRIHLVRPVPALASSYQVPLPGVLRLPHGELHVQPDERGISPAGPVVVRFRRGGERLGTGGHHRALKQLFQEAGVPPWRRPVYPLLYDRLGLLAVPGIAERDAADAATAGPAPRFRVEWHPR